LGKVAGAWIWP